MKVRDRALKKEVAVRDAHCLRRFCYQPREWQGALIPGVGLQRGQDEDWRCIRREYHGCPQPLPETCKKANGRKKE